MCIIFCTVTWCHPFLRAGPLSSAVRGLGTLCVWSLAVNSFCRVLRWQKAQALELSIPDLNPVTPAYWPWLAIVCRVAESQTRPKRLSTAHSTPAYQLYGLEKLCNHSSWFPLGQMGIFLCRAIVRIEMWRQLSWGQHIGYTQINASYCSVLLLAATATAEERDRKVTLSCKLSWLSVATAENGMVNISNSESYDWIWRLSVCCSL